LESRLAALLSERLISSIEKAQRAGDRDSPLACLARFGNHFEPFQAFYSRSLVPRLEGLFESARSAGGSDSGGEFPRTTLQPSFKELFAGQRVEFIAEAEVRELSPDWGVFRNINTPLDLMAWKGIR
ncbi:MAG: hypothetical protein WCL50_08455, partial [Spirochaetota bacterium]